MFEIGDIVYSICGRDKGSCFLVVDIHDKFVYICDGKKHILGKPKMKNVIHLKFVSKTDNLIEMLKNKSITNKHIHNVLKNWTR
jgi:ribosomal protein L14E/L6E/L27E